MSLEKAIARVAKKCLDKGHIAEARELLKLAEDGFTMQVPDPPKGAPPEGFTMSDTPDEVPKPKEVTPPDPAKGTNETLAIPPAENMQEVAGKVKQKRIEIAQKLLAKNETRLAKEILDL